MRLNPQLTILAHFPWGSRTTLLQYLRERSEDELADSLTDRSAWATTT